MIAFFISIGVVGVASVTFLSMWVSSILGENNETNIIAKEVYKK